MRANSAQVSVPEITSATAPPLDSWPSFSSSSSKFHSFPSSSSSLVPPPAAAPLDFPFALSVLFLFYFLPPPPVPSNSAAVALLPPPDLSSPPTCTSRANRQAGSSEDPPGTSRSLAKQTQSNESDRALDAAARRHRYTKNRLPNNRISVPRLTSHSVADA